MNAPLNTLMSDAITSALGEDAVIDRYKALSIVDDIGVSHILSGFAFRLSGWLNAKLIGNANAIVQKLTKDGYDVKALDAKCVRELLKGPDGEANDRLDDMHACHALLNYVAGWGEVAPLQSTLQFMCSNTESKINAELMLVIVTRKLTRNNKKRGKSTDNVAAQAEEMVDRLVLIDEAQEKLNAKRLESASPNVLWMVEHVFGDYTDADAARDGASDELIASLDERLLTIAKKLDDQALLNVVKQRGDWTLSDNEMIWDIIDQLENL